MISNLFFFAAMVLSRGVLDVYRETLAQRVVRPTFLFFCPGQNREAFDDTPLWSSLGTR